MALLTRLLRAFFSLPYSTDLDGKDVETLLRIVKGAQGRPSKRKELFDIVDGTVGYSVKTLRKSLASVRVDLQEQRFCDVKETRRMLGDGDGNPDKQGSLLLGYMKNRIEQQMAARTVTVAKSLVLLKDWNAARTIFTFRYWEEDFYEHVKSLCNRNSAGEIEWVLQSAGIHARDKLRQDGGGRNVRLLRMHHKHNQIFTDHDIPGDSLVIRFQAQPLGWLELAEKIGCE